LSGPWLGSGISFLLAFYTGKGLTPELYAIISMVFLPFSMFFWMTAFTDFIMKKHQKLILILFTINAIVFEICLFYFLSVDPDLIIILRDPVDAEYQTIIRIFILSYIIIILITGILFARELLKSENPEIRLKGKLLMAGFLSWTFGGTLDGLLPLNLITLSVARIILISSAIFFYFGFLGKMEEPEDLEIETVEVKDEIQDFLKMVSRHKHKQVTEEEVKFYREQTICLVCKNHLIGYTLNFICFECRALYCAKCARAISKLENACWACNNPIDESKPVKLPEKRKEEVPVEDLANKKKKSN
jgi:hypothetical protein